MECVMPAEPPSTRWLGACAHFVTTSMTTVHRSSLLAPGKQACALKAASRLDRPTHCALAPSEEQSVTIKQKHEVASNKRRTPQDAWQDAWHGC